MQKVAGIVLAGGKSSRMGRDKARLNYGNKDFIERSIMTLTPVSDVVYVSCGPIYQYQEYGAPVIVDDIQDTGPLGGMVTVMREVQADIFLFLPVDTPLIPTALYECLLQNMEGYDAVIPELHDFYEPLCALYRKSCLPYMEKAIKAGKRKIKSFYPDIHIKALKEEELEHIGNLDVLFLNVNEHKHYLHMKRLKNE
ncbi:molybdenum cofactor guanylyltransferase [Clostridia bacterium]|nr:molybdenum cofactor guanylyltransferase [Clostridia bacterium]